jgi:tungstate transport system substrate-binding protein
MPAVVGRPFQGRRYWIWLAALLLTAAGCSKPEPPLIVLATTTSVANSGLLDQVVPVFESWAHARVRAVPVGSGRALAMLDARQANVAITHAPAQETAALKKHPSWSYRKILYNDFLIVGPPDDPSHVAKAADALDAMRRIAAGTTRFISRGDESGTDEREKQLWKDAGITPSPSLVISAGQGMGATLNIASETGAYTLTDRGTFEQFAGKRALKELSSGDPRLLNTYAVIVDPTDEGGLGFARWVSEGAGRGAIVSRLASGQLRGFAVWPAGAPNGTPADVPWIRRP